jgi:hypothetical protein
VSISSGSGSTVAALQIGSNPSSPQPLPAPPVPSISSTPSPRSLTPAPSTASRESVTNLVIPSDRHVPEALYHDTPSLSTSQLQQSRSSPLVSSMVFNQESPYPVHVLSSNATRRHHRTASQTSCRRHHRHHNHHQKGKGYRAKSILKSRRTEGSTSPLPTEQHAVSKSQSRTDTVLSRSSSSGGGGRVTPPSSSS